ncbi:ABC transporter substrate-binding protein [Paenibacillus sp. strain BS8-2]
MRNRKKSTFYITVTLAAILMTLLAGCGREDAKPASGGAAGAQSDPISIKIADIVSNPVFRVAKNKGFFEKYGIEAEIVTFATPAEGINSLFIKQADIGFGADFPVLNAVSKGEFSILASTGSDTDAAAAQWKLFVREEVKTGADLKGKKLSSLRGTFLPYLWDVYLKENGVNMEDTEQIGQGGLDETYAAIKRGDIDAAWVAGAVLIDKFKEIEGVHELSDMSKTSVRIGGSIIAPNSLIKDHPVAVANFLRAVDEASTFIAANPDETADILYEEVKQPREATLRDVQYNNWNIGFKQESYESLSAQKTYMVGAGIIKDDFELNAKLGLDAITEAIPDRVTYKK